MISLICASLCAFVLGRISVKFGNAELRAYCRYSFRDEYIVRMFAIDFISCAKEALRLACNGVNWPMDELKEIVENVCGHRMCYLEAIEYINRLEKQMKI